MVIRFNCLSINRLCEKKIFFAKQETDLASDYAISVPASEFDREVLLSML